MQKSKKSYDLPRFRRYVGNNYIKSDTIIENGKTKKVSLPLKTIYFLGFRLQNVRVPILHVKREYYNAITKRQLKVIEDFVEYLSHNMFAIQIPRLKMVAQTESEKILDIFNQQKYGTNDKRILDYTGDLSNPIVKRIVKELHKVLQDENVLEAMIVEEEVDNEIETHLAEIEQLKLEKEAAQKAQELERAEKESALKREQELLQTIALLEKKLGNQAIDE